jgi:hypothetical protein
MFVNPDVSPVRASALAWLIVLGGKAGGGTVVVVGGMAVGGVVVGGVGAGSVVVVAVVVVEIALRSVPEVLAIVDVELHPTSSRGTRNAVTADETPPMCFFTSPPF